MEKGAFAAGVVARHHIREGVPPHWCVRPLLWAELLKLTEPWDVARSPSQRQAAPEYLSCEGAWFSPLPSRAPNSTRKGGLPLNSGTRLFRSPALLWLSRFPYEVPGVLPGSWWLGTPCVVLLWLGTPRAVL